MLSVCCRYVDVCLVVVMKVSELAVVIVGCCALIVFHLRVCAECVVLLHVALMCS